MTTTTPGTVAAAIVLVAFVTTGSQQSSPEAGDAGPYRPSQEDGQAGLPSLQEPTLVPDAPLCPDCRIGYEHVVRLGTSEGPGSIDAFPQSVSRDSFGRIIVAVGRTSKMLAFSRDGSFLRLLAGPSGGARAAIPVEDRLLVFDAGAGEAVWFEPDLSPGRSVHFQERVMQGLHLGEGRLLAVYAGRTRETIGLPLHVLELSGDSLHRVRSFGEPREAVLSAGQMSRRISRSGDSIWTAERHRYRLEKWSVGGDLLQVLDRRPLWFDGHQPNTIGNPEAPPAPFLMDLYVDSIGRVWTASMKPREDWAEAWKAYSSADGVKRRPLYRELYEMAVEVISPAQGRVFVRSVTDEVPIGFLDDGRLAALEESGTGGGHVHIWRVHVSEPQTQEANR